MFIYLRRLLIICCCALLPLSCYASSWLTKEQMQTLAAELEEQAQIPQKWTIDQLNKAKHQAKIKPLFHPKLAPGKRNWFNYQKNALDNVRLNSGVKFYHQYKDVLERAEKSFKVDTWVILGILGMETNFGAVSGNFKAFDVLTTLAFDFPRNHPRFTERQNFFRQELKMLLQLSYRGQINLHSTKSSFAGAIGWAQFMPSSIEKYAVDGDGDGKINLYNAADAIFSIANYLAQFNWQHKQPAYYAVDISSVTTTDLAKLIANDIFPNFTSEELQTVKVKFMEPVSQQPDNQAKLAIIKLENGDMLPTYVAGSTNFYAITRYNKSSYYAMAVTELGQEILRLATPTTH